MIKLIGFAAMILIQGSTLFQIVKFYKIKKVDGVSILFWWAVFVGLILYLIYSIFIQDIVYITSNSIGMVLSGISIGMYYGYKRR